MPLKKHVTKKQKIYFIYFMIFSVIVILIFAYMIIGTYGNYWYQIYDMEKYYKNRAQKLTSFYPQIQPNDPVKGINSATVTIYEFSDFLCPACKKMQNDLQAIEKAYGNKVKFVFKGVPVTITPQTRPALNAAYCANEQNAFWQYKDLLFANQSALNNQKYLELASQLELDLSKFNPCLEENKYDSVIGTNLSDALKLQISSVPTIYINQQKVEGMINYNLLDNIINQNL